MIGMVRYRTVDVFESIIASNAAWFESCVIHAARDLGLPNAPSADPRLAIIRADLRDGGAWGDGYTTVLLINLVPHLSEPELLRTLQRARRSLAPGGRVVVLCPVPQPEMVGAASELLFYMMSGRRLRWPETLSAALANAGFEDVQNVTLETTTAAVLVGRA